MFPVTPTVTSDYRTSREGKGEGGFLSPGGYLRVSGCGSVFAGKKKEPVTKGVTIKDKSYLLLVTTWYC